MDKKQLAVLIYALIFIPIIIILIWIGVYVPWLGWGLFLLGCLGSGILLWAEYL